MQDATTPTVLIIHAVSDYAHWKSAFDAAAELRKAAGEQRYDLLRFEDEPTRLVHLSEWTSLRAARDFFESAEVARIRCEAGVHAPQFCYLERIGRGVL